MELQSPGSPGREKPFGCGSRGESQGEPLTGREAATPSIIREIEKVQGGEQAPRNGNLALPKDMAVEPLSPKGLLNANLKLMLPTLARRSDGPPSGHANLGRGLPRLKEDTFERVPAVEVSATSLRPEVVNQEAPEDVEGLAAISEAARVITVEVESHKVYYKGEGGGFPQVRAVVSLVCPCCPWLVLAPKVLQLCTNHFVWVVCRPV
jgi:hypothetical protein